MGNAIQNGVLYSDPDSGADEPKPVRYFRQKSSSGRVAMKSQQTDCANSNEDGRFETTFQNSRCCEQFALVPAMVGLILQKRRKRQQCHKRRWSRPVQNRDGTGSNERDGHLIIL